MVRTHYATLDFTLKRLSILSYPILYPITHQIAQPDGHPPRSSYISGQSVGGRLSMDTCMIRQQSDTTLSCLLNTNSINFSRLYRFLNLFNSFPFQGRIYVSVSAGRTHFGPLHKLILISFKSDCLPFISPFELGFGLNSRSNSYTRFETFHESQE